MLVCFLVWRFFSSLSFKPDTKEEKWKVLFWRHSLHSTTLMVWQEVHAMHSRTVPVRGSCRVPNWGSAPHTCLCTEWEQCVCVCVWEREREREREKGHRMRAEWERVRERWRGTQGLCCGFCVIVCVCVCERERERERRGTEWEQSEREMKHARVVLWF